MREMKLLTRISRMREISEVNEKRKRKRPCFFFIFFWNAAVFWGILPSAVFLAVTGKMRIQQKINRP